MRATSRFPRLSARAGARAPGGGVPTGPARGPSCAAAAPSRVPARAEGRLAPWLLAVGWGVVSATLVVQALAPELVAGYALWPLLIGIVVVGLPHGALDHLVPARTGRSWGRRPLPFTLFLAAYLAAAGTYVVVWRVAPFVAFVGFLALTVWHWGQGDLRFLEIFLQRRRTGAAAALVTIVTRGALPIVVPILAFPATADDLLVRASGALGLSAPAWTPSDPALQAGLGAALAALLVGYLVTALRAARDVRGASVDLAEVGLLLAFFALVPAYAAVGAYFLAWHSLRHLARLLLLRPQDADAVRRGAVARPVARLARDLVPITVTAIVILAASAFWARGNLTSLDDFVALYLVMISALTVPHAMVVAMMDRPGRRPAVPEATPAGR